jgi:hypothetical protein
METANQATCGTPTQGGEPMDYGRVTTVDEKEGNV